MNAWKISLVVVLFMKIHGNVLDKVLMIFSVTLKIRRGQKLFSHHCSCQFSVYLSCLLIILMRWHTLSSPKKILTHFLLRQCQGQIAFSGAWCYIIYRNNMFRHSSEDIMCQPRPCSVMYPLSKYCSQSEDRSPKGNLSMREGIVSPCDPTG